MQTCVKSSVGRKATFDHKLRFLSKLLPLIVACGACSEGPTNVSAPGSDDHSIAVVAPEMDRPTGIVRNTSYDPSKPRIEMYRAGLLVEVVQEGRTKLPPVVPVGLNTQLDVSPLDYLAAHPGSDRTAKFAAHLKRLKKAAEEDDKKALYKERVSVLAATPHRKYKDENGNTVHEFRLDDFMARFIFPAGQEPSPPVHTVDADVACDPEVMNCALSEQEQLEETVAYVMAEATWMLEEADVLLSYISTMEQGTVLYDSDSEEIAEGKLGCLMYLLGATTLTMRALMDICAIAALGSAQLSLAAAGEMVKLAIDAGVTLAGAWALVRSAPCGY